MSQLNNYTKIYENTYIKNNVDVLGKCNIKGDLSVNKLKIASSLKVKNFIYINKNLNVKKDIFSTNIEINPICYINNNIYIEKNLNSNNSFECSSLNSSELNLYLNDNYNNYKFNNNIIINNTTFTNNYALLKNLFLYDNLYTNNYNTINSNINVLNTKDCIIKNNVNTNYLININNNIDLKYLNVSGNINVKNNIDINYDNIKFGENSIFVLGNNIYNYNIPFSLRHNNFKHTLEVFINKKWRSISHLYTPDYKTSILFKENNSVDAHSILFIQNRNVSIDFNNIFKNIEIYKNTVNIFNNLNIKNSLIGYNNLNIKQNLTLNNDIIIKGLLKLPYSNNNEGYKSLLRYNKLKNEIELYKNNWSYMNWSNEYNGLLIDENNNLNLYTSKNTGFILNNNIFHIKNNLDIFSNINVSSGLNVKKNINIENCIIFDNKSLLKYNTNSILAYVSPNYNNTIFNNYKYLNINDEIKDRYLHNYYESDYYYCLTNDIQFNYVVSDSQYYKNDLIVDYNNCFIYHVFSISDLLIEKFKINAYINNNNVINNIDFPLNNQYHILINDNNSNIIFDNMYYTKRNLILKKNTIYTIKIKTINLSNKDIFLFIKLIGRYYNNILFENKQAEFLYKIDNSFFGRTTIMNNCNLNKYIFFNGNVNTNYLSLSNLHINSNSNNNLFTINNNLNENIFSIKNNCIIIGNCNLNNINSNLKKIYIKNSIYNDTLFVDGETIIKQNVYVSNDLNIYNNCILNNSLKYDKSEINFKYNIIVSNNINFYDNLNCLNLYSENLYTKINNENLLYLSNIDKINNNNLNKLKNYNITINNNNINFNNKLLINCDNNLNINSNESFNLFSIGNKYKPNISISHNGEVKLYTNKLKINNINIMNIIENLKKLMI